MIFRNNLQLELLYEMEEEISFQSQLSFWTLKVEKMQGLKWSVMHTYDERFSFALLKVFALNEIFENKVPEMRRFLSDISMTYISISLMIFLT